MEIKSYNKEYRQVFKEKNKQVAREIMSNISEDKTTASKNKNSVKDVEDIFTKSNENNSESVTYTFQKTTVLRKLSLEEYIRVNNANCRVGGRASDGGPAIWEVDGLRFSDLQIPKISTKKLKEVHADNNVMDFGKNQFLKYVDSKNEEHLIFSGESGIKGHVFDGSGYSSIDKTAEDYATFWRYLMNDSLVFISLMFSEKTIETYLADAGVEKGFFTVKMGGKEAEVFYSDATKYTNVRYNVVHSKKEYDDEYFVYTKSGLLKDSYNPGDVFQLGDKEYVLKDDYTLDIPYGEDMFILYGPNHMNYDHSRVRSE